jgi:micrococcal nuclease
MKLPKGFKKFPPWLQVVTLVILAASFYFSSQKKVSLPLPTAFESGKSYQVIEVVDGDTVKVEIDGASATLRLIGLDTPETVDPRKPVQCFGREASDRAKELLSGKRVVLESDPTQGEKDTYSRLLAYVRFEDGVLFNQKMISDGYAHEYTYEAPYKYQVQFKQAEREARQAGRGLWSGSTCGGNTSS